MVGDHHAIAVSTKQDKTAVHTMVQDDIAGRRGRPLDVIHRVAALQGCATMCPGTWRGSVSGRGHALSRQRLKRCLAIGYPRSSLRRYMAIA